MEAVLKLCWNSGFQNGDYEKYYILEYNPRSPVDVRRHFGGLYCLHLHSEKVILASNQQAASRANQK
jgi:hypothetical protein